jgi:ABC-type nitrate/sulfonate/bicarbonate transport system permease component
MKRFTHFFTSIRNNIIAFFLFIIIWFILALFFPPYIVPSPLMIFTQLSSYLHPTFLFHLSLTLYRVFTGFFYAFTLGTLLGILASRMNKVQYLNTLMVLLQVLPGTILGIVFLLVFGIGSKVPIALVAFLTLPAVSINTSNALSKKNVVTVHDGSSYN